MSRETEIAVLPEGWIWSTVAEVGAVQLGRQRSPKNRSGQYPTRYIRAANITEHGLDLADILDMNFSPAEKARYLLANGDILLSEASGSSSQVGKPAVWRGDSEEYCFQNTVIRHRCHYQGTTPYLYYLYKNFYVNAVFAKIAGGVGINHLSAAKFSNIPVPLAPLTEQYRIVSEIEKQFPRLDAAEASLRRAQAKLKRQRAAVLKAACEGRLARQDDDWSVKTIADLNPSDRPCAYGVLQPGVDMEEGIPFVRVGDIEHGRVSILDLKRIDPAISAKYPRTRLRGGEVLISLVGTIGRTAVAPESLAGANTARAVGVIPLISEVLPEWVNIWFRNPSKVQQMNGKAHEVARKTLNLEDVRKAEVAIPNLSEQRRIIAEVDRRLSAIEAMEAQVEKNLLRSKKLRQSILKRAFEGKLVPQDPNDEPASVLLDRIRNQAPSPKKTRV